MKIDTSKWGEFLIGDLFEKCDLKCKKANFNKAIDCSEIYNEEFSLPLVNAKHTNNGIQFYGRANEWDTEEMTLDIVSNGAVATGDVYAQPQRTGVLWDAYLVKPLFECSSEYVLHFLACVVQRCVKQYFSWNDKCTWDKVKTKTVMLPVKSSGEPDWDYMSSYMCKVQQDVDNTLNLLKSTDVENNEAIDTSTWLECKIIDLFELSLPSGDLQVKKVVEGNIPLITPSNTNNGQLKRISEKSNSTLYKGNSLTVDMFGNAYYQEEDFFVTAHGHVNVLIPKMKMNKYIGWFIATAIKKMFLNKYNFVDMCTQKVLKKEVISLPQNAKGEVDWKFMEDYMKKKEKMANKKLMTLM